MYIYRLLYQNFSITAKQKSTIDTQIRKINSNTTLKIVIEPEEGENKRRREEKKSKRNKSKTVTKMAITTDIPKITLNVNGLNAPTKTHKLAEWIQEQDPYICCLQETHFSSRNTYKLKVEDGRNYCMQTEIKRKLE